MNNVIVTGANGFIGSTLIKKLIANNVHVIAIDVNFDGNRIPESELILKIQTSIDDTLIEKIPKADYDALYNLAWRGVNGIEKANPSIQLHNIQMAINCADICKQLNVKKLLCAGTVAENAVYSLPHLQSTNAGMMYGVAKHNCHLMLETYCKTINQPFVWMQFSNIYGVGNKTGNLVSYTLGEILQGREATFGPALQPYDFIYVDDLIEAVYRLGDIKTPQGTYFIGSGDSRQLKDFLLEIGRLANRESLIRLGIRPDDGIKYIPDMFDTTKLQSIIGNYAQTSFEEGINKTISWLSNL